MTNGMMVKKKPKILMAKPRKIVPKRIMRVRPLNAFEQRVYQRYKGAIDASWEFNKVVYRGMGMNKNDLVRAFIKDSEKVAAAGAGKTVYVTPALSSYARACERFAKEITDLASRMKGRSDRQKIAAAIKAIRKPPAKIVSRKAPAVKKVYRYTYYVASCPGVRDIKKDRARRKFEITSSKPISEMTLATLASAKTEKQFQAGLKENGITRFTNQGTFRKVISREILPLKTLLVKVSEKTIKPRKRA
jgi:hypothetical protein